MVLPICRVITAAFMVYFPLMLQFITGHWRQKYIDESRKKNYSASTRVHHPHNTIKIQIWIYTKNGGQKYEKKTFQNQN